MDMKLHRKTVITELENKNYSKWRQRSIYLTDA